MELSSRKKQKAVARPNVCENGIDKISRLPDDILHYILSFVDVVDVIRSSKLSRRWRSLWTTMPYLNFDIVNFGCQDLHLIGFEDGIDENFNELISWVLMRQGSTKITRFRLSCDNLFYNDKIARWIDVVARRNVEELDLDFNSRQEGEPFELPDCLIRCESLRILKLSLAGSVLKLPGYLKFNQLRSVRLERVELTDENLTRRLFSECSSLEDLILLDCVMKNMVVIDISSSSLKCLTLINSFFNEENGGFGRSQISISCPNLISFTYMAGAAKNYCLNNLTSIDKICIDIFPEDESCSSENVGHLACNILEQVENIRVLKLHVRAIWFLSYAIEELQCFSKTFIRLKSLNLSVEIAEDYTQVMLLLLKYCPNLESLTLYCDEILNFDEVENEYSQSYDREHHQLRFVKFMLKNGIVLENFIINFSENVENSLSTVQRLLSLLQ